MSLGLTAQSTPDQVSAAIFRETKRRGYSRAESVACDSTAEQESSRRPGAVSPNGKWRGIYQQDGGYPGRDDPNQNILAFLDRLDVKRRSPGASPDPFKNIFWLQQRPSEKSADAAYNNGRKAYYDEIRRHIAASEARYDRLGGTTPAPAPREGYGLPKGTRITYGSPGFPDWVYRLAAHFNVKASTYPGHQETNRNEAGYAPNPQLLNRGIDWAGSNGDMQRLADYLFSIRGELEQLIWENPQTNRRLGVAGGKDVTATGYYAYPGGYDGHRDHVHTRQDHALPVPGGAQPAPAPPKPAIQRHGDPVWLPEVLRAEGLTVVEMAGWRDRGHGDFSEIWGIVAHHTGSNNASPESIAFHPSLGLASQIHLARNGVVTLCGAGIAWHAGNGSWPGLPANGANSRTIGIEAANDGGGSPGKPHRSSWPVEQYDAYVKVCAAILRKLGWGVDHLIAHKEWAGRAQGKWDPGAIDMNIFRADVAARLTNSPTQPSGDDMALVPQDQWDRVFRELTQQHPSRSPLRALGEGDVDTWAGMSLNSDGNIHVIATHLRALLGHPKTLRDLEKLATADPAKWPDRRDDIQLAQSILADVTATPQPVLTTARVQSITEAPDTGALVSAVTAAVHDAAASIPAPVVINQAPEQPAPSTVFTGTPGQVLGQVYDAIAALDLSADLPPETKAALSAVVSILQVKIGASA